MKYFYNLYCRSLKKNKKQNKTKKQKQNKTKLKTKKQNKTYKVFFRYLWRIVSLLIEVFD